MKRLLLIMLLVLSASPAYAEWVEIDSTDTYTLYADPDTILRKEDLVKMWVLYDYKIAMSVKGEMTFSAMSQSEYDCVAESSRSLAFTFFSGHMRTGETLYSNSYIGKWEPVPPGGISHSMWKFACDKK
jgi:hypothetical protein